MTKKKRRNKKKTWTFNTEKSRISDRSTIVGMFSNVTGEIPYRLLPIYFSIKVQKIQC